MVRVRGGLHWFSLKSSTQLEPNIGYGAFLDWCLRKVQVMAAPSTDQTGGFKRFSGSGANGRDLKRWKTWCLSKMITMSTLTKEARGPSVYSMLDEDALTAVEHLEFPEFATEGGENVISPSWKPDIWIKIRLIGRRVTCVYIDAGCRTISAQWCWDAQEASTKLRQLHLR